MRCFTSVRVGSFSNAPTDYNESLAVSSLSLQNFSEAHENAGTLRVNVKRLQ